MHSKSDRPSKMLLKLRTGREDLARQGFSLAAGEAAAIDARLKELGRALRLHTSDLAELLSAGADKVAVSLHHRCIADIRQGISGEQARLAVADRSLRQRQEQLLNATKQRRVAETVAGRQAGRRDRAMQYLGAGLIGASRAL